MVKAKAPVKYLFNYHEWCDTEWCWAKQLDEKEVGLTNKHIKEMNTGTVDYDSDSSASSWETISSSNDDSMDDNSTPPLEVRHSKSEVQRLKSLLSIPPHVPAIEPAIKPTTTVVQNEDYEEIEPTWDPLDGVDESTDDKDKEDYIGLDAYALKIRQFSAKYNQTHECNETMFTVEDLEEIKTRERVMMERTGRGYYRSKTDHDRKR